MRSSYHRFLCWCAAAALAPVALVAQAPDPGAPPRTSGPRAGTLPSENESLATQMVARGDRNADASLDGAELEALLDGWYAALIAGGSELTPELLSREYYNVLDPAARAAGLIGGAQGGGAQATALFAALDADKDGRLAREELASGFAGWFVAWGGSDGRALGAGEIASGLDAVLPRRQGFRWRGRPPRDEVEVDFSPRPPITGVSPEEELERLELPPGYRLELALKEPAVEDPMAIAFDGNGRLYVLELRTYMRDLDGTGTMLPENRISVHEDLDGDGEYERHAVFLDGLVFPRFVLPLDRGVVLTMESDSRDIYAHRDVDGDLVADERELFASDMNRDDVNVEHMSSSLFWAMDNHLYITTSDIRLRVTAAGVERERISPNTGQWGLSQDDYGRLFFQGGANGIPVQFQAVPAYGSFSFEDELQEGYTEPWGLPGPGDHQGGVTTLREDGSLNRVTGAAGSQVFRGDRLPRDLAGDYISAEVVARIVRRSEVADVEGMTQLRNVYQADRSEFIRSSDPLFRPMDVQTAPDGTLYVVDAYRGVVQESEWTPEGSYLRQKVQQYALDRNTGRGRIWRVRYDGIERDTTRPRMLDQTAAELVPYLEHPNGWWRDQAQKLLVLRRDPGVVPALEAMARGSGELGRIHALWTLEGLGAASPALVREALADENPRLRAAAIRIAETLYREGDDSLAGAIADLARSDADPRVVIQALLTLSYLRVPGSDDLVRLVTAGTPARGVREFGGQILSPRAGFRDALLLRAYSEPQRESLRRGGEIYGALCVVCHAPDGEGTPVPDSDMRMAASFAGSSLLQGDPEYAISALLFGLSGSREEGPRHSETMVGLGRGNPDQWSADVLSFVRNSFGNAASMVAPGDVARVRASNASRIRPWPIPELLRATSRVVPYAPDWVLSASANAEMAGFAINSSGAISWSAGEPQAAGQWFSVELPRPTRLSGLELVAPAFGGSPPSRFAVEVSTDGESWTPVADEARGEFPGVRVGFEAVQTRRLRVRLLDPEDEAEPWSIQKLRLFAPPESPIGR